MALEEAAGVLEEVVYEERLVNDCDVRKAEIQVKMERIRMEPERLRVEAELVNSEAAKLKSQAEVVNSEAAKLKSQAEVVNSDTANVKARTELVNAEARARHMDRLLELLQAQSIDRELAKLLIGLVH